MAREGLVALLCVWLFSFLFSSFLTGMSLRGVYGSRVGGLRELMVGTLGVLSGGVSLGVGGGWKEGM